jgi:membrane-bound serine protease (ClpP class)
MEAFAIVALIGLGLLVAELLLPTGGVLAALGVVGLTVGGVLALGSNDNAGAYIGAALITGGVLAGASFVYISRKVIHTTRDLPPLAGTEEMVGESAVARSAIAPAGNVFMRGTLWSARLADGASPIGAGDRVRVEAVDGLTLVVEPLPTAAAQTARQGGS